MTVLKTARSRAQLRAGRSDWYRITNIADRPNDAAIYVYDEIGYFGVTAQDFVHDLQNLKVTNIDLHINSPGGDVFDGIAIYNAIKNHPAHVTTRIDGLAASAASFIAQAGDDVKIARNAQLMIHDASGVCIGNAKDMAELAALLEKCSNNIADIYAQRAGGSVDDWRERMRVETWYSAAEAVTAGLADEIDSVASGGPTATPTDSWDLSIFAYQSRQQAPPPVPVPRDATVIDVAVGPHNTTAKEGTWDASANESHLPSPVPLATARKFYAAYDGDAVTEGAIPKSAGHLPHHFVDADGKPGAASINGVKNALARLPQTKGLSDAERATVEQHLHNHLPSGDQENHAEEQHISEIIRSVVRAAHSKEAVK